MRFVGVEEREAMVAGLTVSAVSIFLLATYVKFHDVYENLGNYVAKSAESLDL